jgi:hypothetical protein
MKQSSENGQQVSSEVRDALQDALERLNDVSGDLATLLLKLNGQMVQRTYAFCCNGDPQGCSCVNPDHGTVNHFVGGQA